jgi:hypothetical protein
MPPNTDFHVGGMRKEKILIAVIVDTAFPVSAKPFFNPDPDAFVKSRKFPPAGRPCHHCKNAISNECGKS